MGKNQIRATLTVSAKIQPGNLLWQHGLGRVNELSSPTAFPEAMICLSEFRIVGAGPQHRGGPPTWMVKIMEKPYEQMDDLGGKNPPLFLETAM